MDTLPQQDVEGIPGDDSRCVSIIYRVSAAQESRFLESKGRGGPHRFDTLDLIVSKPDDYLFLVTTLQDIVKRYREDIKSYSPRLLFMEFHWIDLEKELSQKINYADFVTLCDRMNLPLQKSQIQSYYKDFCRELGAEDDCINFRQTCSLIDLIQEVSVDYLDGEGESHPIDQLWRRILETDPIPLPTNVKVDKQMEIDMELNPVEATISAVAFLSFLRSQQREFTSSLEDVHYLASLIQAQVTYDDIKPELDTLKRVNAMERERIKKSCFQAFMTSDWNDLMDPKLGIVDACDMTQPLSHYWINASHDTYLGRLSNCFLPKPSMDATHTLVDIQMYVDALNRGVRCLEVDCWDGLYGEPVVARKKPVTNSLASQAAIPFLDILRILRSFLKDNPNSFPIILYVENHCSLSKQEVMANDLVDILGAENLLFVPAETWNSAIALPSPNALRGKVIVKCKRPKTIKEGATIFNDDFDGQNAILEDDEDVILDSILEDEDDDEDEIKGWVIGFEAAGPIRSNLPNFDKKSPDIMLEEASREASIAKRDSELADLRANELKRDAVDAQVWASRLASDCGLTVGQIQARALQESPMEADEAESVETALRELTAIGKGETEPSNQGIEVQDFFGEAVEGARTTHSTADTEAIQASLAEEEASAMMNAAEEALRKAEKALENSYRAEKEISEASRKASIEARAYREHADTARSRVDTVKGLQRKVKDGASSAETVVITAQTEARISEQRAAATEVRASRVLANADKERAGAEIETKREERLEQEAAQYHEICVEATKLAKTSRDKLEKATGMLDRCNEQIKLIEKSSQFQQEMRASNKNQRGDSDGGPRYSSRFLDKHAAKLEERKMCTLLIKESAVENAAAEVKRRRAQTAFEDAAHNWKAQAEVAASARKQADRSSQIAEEIAEHAEEEREAANLRHIAREKAQSSVSETETNLTSVHAQLAEAERASAEASSLATESRHKAERLAREASIASDHSRALHAVEMSKTSRAAAILAYDNALKTKMSSHSKARNAKRLYETSSEVFTNAKREAAAEVHNLNARQQFEKHAVLAYNKSLVMKKQAEHATSLAKIVANAAAEKAAAARHAKDFKERADMSSVISPRLASITSLHSCKFRYWEKSHSLPSYHMHSFSQSLILDKLERNAEINRDGFIKFTRTHLCRTFPSWKVTEKSSTLNFDPVTQHSLGCQIVSMNFHSSDERLLVNDGRFRANGSTGYVLKPSQLIMDECPQEREQQWKLSILSGSCLPKAESSMAKRSLSVNLSPAPVIPFVRVTLFQGDLDGPRIVHSTSPAKYIGLNPVWDNQEDTFDVTVLKPSVAVVLFSVWDAQSKDFIAGAAIPFLCFREGYRSIALFDSMHTRCGPYAFASLFVKAQKLS